MDGNRREILTEQEIQFLDEDVFYQQESDERARYWWVEQDKEARNKSYQKWRDFIVPTEKDLAWTRIPWRTSFQQGLIESIEKQKPMLLWAMNGHPLGCT